MAEPPPLYTVLQADPEQVGYLQEALNISPFLATLLVTQGYTDPDLAETLFTDDLECLHSPGLLDGLEHAAELVAHSVEVGDRILVHGDFDADGVTATALLVSFLRDIGAEVKGYIPHRVDEGYGLSEEGIRQHAEQGYTLLVSVDCGSSSSEEVDVARSVGFTTVITDHHRVPPTPPRADAFVNPVAPGSTYPFKGLSGVGVAYKLVQALCERLGRGTPEAYLDLVAIGTMADVVSITGENRILVREGLERLNRQPRCGLRALIDEIWPSGPPKKLRATDLSFSVVPCINAPGRLRHAQPALDLLLETDLDSARSLAQSLAWFNKNRKLASTSLRKTVQERVLARRVQDQRIILEGEASWEPGLVGLVAGKIREKFDCTTLLMSIDQEGIAKGSGRSTEDVDLHALLSDCQDLLIRFGGHPRAAGFQIRADQIEMFRDRLERALSSQSKQITPRFKVDWEMGFADMDEQLLKDLDLLEPFGKENEAPTFLTRNVTVLSADQRGADTLTVNVVQGGREFKCVNFDLGALAPHLRIGQQVDVLYTRAYNTFQGKTTLELHLKAIIDAQGRLLEAPEPGASLSKAPASSKTAPSQENGRVAAPPAAAPTRTPPLPSGGSPSELVFVDARSHPNPGRYLADLLAQGQPVHVLTARDEVDTVQRLCQGAAPQAPATLRIFHFEESLPLEGASDWVLWSPPRDRPLLQKLLAACNGRLHVLVGPDTLGHREVLLKQFGPSRDTIGQVYQALRQAHPDEVPRTGHKAVVDQLGNPLVTEHTVVRVVKMFAEIGVLAEQGGALRWTGAKGELQTSPTYQQGGKLLAGYAEVRRIFQAPEGTIGEHLSPLR